MPGVSTHFHWGPY